MSPDIKPNDFFHSAMLKLFIFSIIIVFISIPAKSQDLTGTWEGKIDKGEVNYDYTLYLSKDSRGKYFGVSVIRQRVSVLRGSNLELGNALEKRPRFIKRLIGEQEGDAFHFLEFMQLEPATTGFKSYSASLQVNTSKSKPSLIRTGTNGQGSYELFKKSDKFPAEYLQYEIPADAFTVNEVHIKNSAGGNKVRFTDWGSLSLSMRSLLGNINNIAVNYSFSSTDSGIVLISGNNKLLNINDKGGSYELVKILTAYNIPDSLHLRLTLSMADFELYTKDLVLPAEPFLKTGNVAVSAGSASRLKVLSGYYGFNKTRIRPVNLRLDSMDAHGDKAALMWKAIFEYLGKGGYRVNEKAGSEHAAVAREFVETAARNGDAEAMYLLFYANEIRGKQTGMINSSTVLLEYAAGAGFTPAIYDRAAACYQKNDYGPALAGFKSAFDNGAIIAASAIGYLYQHGYGTVKSLNDAQAWYRKGIDAGDPEALFKMGMLYASGEDLEPDVNKVLDYCNKAAALSYTPAMYFLGDLYVNGKKGVVQDVPKAVSWFKKAADLNDPNGMESLAFLYVSNDLKNFPKDEKSSFYWAKKAAESAMPNSMALLAKIYGEGTITEKSVIKSRFWYNQAKVNGYGERTKVNHFQDDFLGFLSHADFSSTYYEYTNGRGDRWIESSSLGEDLIGGVMSGIFGSWLESRMNSQPVINGLEMIYEKEGKKIFGGTVTSRFTSSLQLTKGDKVLIKAYGDVKLGMFLHGGPSGVSGYEGYSLIPSFPHGSILAGVNGQYNFIGYRNYFTAGLDGKLQLAVNDADYTNNQGYFDVVIEY